MKCCTAALCTMLLYLPLLSQNTDGDNLFGSSQVHDIHFQFNQTDYWDSLTNNYNLDAYMRCDVTVNGTLLGNCGVKFKGNSSYNNQSQKKSFKIDFNEYVSGQEIDGLKKLNLNNGFKDPAFMREKLMLDFLNRLGIPAPRCTYTRLYINGTLWGLYMLVEEVNSGFLDDRFGDDRGNLFKGDPHGDLRWLGSQTSMYYPHYELKTNEIQNNWSDLVHLVDELNNTPANNFHDSLETVLNTNLWIKNWAASILFSNLDSYIGSGHNYFIYHDSLTDNFQWISWDVNEAFGNFNLGMNVTQMENLSMFYYSTQPQNGRPLIQKMLQDPIYRAGFINEICQMVSLHFSNAIFDPMIDSLANKIRPYVYADNMKFYSNQQFENNINQTVNNTPGLKSFITNRRNALITELASEGCFMAMEETALTPVSVYPNPSSGNIYLHAETPVSTLQVFDITGKLCLNISPDATLGDIPVQLEGLEKGTYFLRVDDKYAQILILE